LALSAVDGYKEAAPTELTKHAFDETAVFFLNSMAVARWAGLRNDGPLGLNLSANGAEFLSPGQRPGNAPLEKSCGLKGRDKRCHAARRAKSRNRRAN
jgi:hypothetical protein